MSYEDGHGLSGKEHKLFLQRKTNENARAKQMRMKGQQEQNSFKVARELDADALRVKMDAIKGNSLVSQNTRETEGLKKQGILKMMWLNRLIKKTIDQRRFSKRRR